MYKHLTREQRYAIYLGKSGRRSNISIAREIGVSPSTVSRELRRNSKPDGSYVWTVAHEKAESVKRREPGNRAVDGLLRWRVMELLTQEQWSPRQIAGWLSRCGVRISHETIYRMIRADASGRLASHCRHRMRYRRRRRPVRTTVARNIRDRVSIHHRPPEADGTRFGDWEMDLIVDRGSNAILTLTERSTNYIMMERLRHGRKAAPLAGVVWRLLAPYRGEGVKTITTDNGSEFACHRTITRRLGAQVYFADSYCAWQKGAVENANKLIRQYLPKGTDISRVTDNRIRTIQHKINARPRLKLNFSTPKTEFFKHF